MANHYANAIDVIAADLSIEQMRRICVDYAKRHPKAFTAAAKKPEKKPMPAPPAPPRGY